MLRFFMYVKKSKKYLPELLQGRRSSATMMSDGTMPKIIIIKTGRKIPVSHSKK